MDDKSLKLISIVLGTLSLIIILFMVVAGFILFKNSDKIINSNLHKPGTQHETEKIQKELANSEVKEHQKPVEPSPDHVTEEEKQVLRNQTEWTLGRIKATGQYFNVLNNEHGERMIWTCENPTDGTFTNWESQTQKGLRSTLAVVVGNEVILSKGLRINDEVKVVADPDRHIEHTKEIVDDINEWLSFHPNEELEVLTENKVIYKFVVPSNNFQCPK